MCVCFKNNRNYDDECVYDVPMVVVEAVVSFCVADTISILQRNVFLLPTNFAAVNHTQIPG